MLYRQPPQGCSFMDLQDDNLRILDYGFFGQAHRNNPGSLQIACKANTGSCCDNHYKRNFNNDVDGLFGSITIYDANFP